MAAATVIVAPAAADLGVIRGKSLCQLNSTATMIIIDGGHTKDSVPVVGWDGGGRQALQPVLGPRAGGQDPGTRKGVRDLSESPGAALVTWNRRPPTE